MRENNSLVIEGTIKTPQIELDQSTGDLVFRGKSIPENAAKVYEPAVGWVTEYVKSPRRTTNVWFDLDYFNTSSLLWLTKILKILISIKEPDYVIILNLHIPIEDFDDINDFEDLKEVFLPISSILQGSIPCVGVKLYGKDDNGVIIKNSLLFIETELKVS